MLNHDHTTCLSRYFAGSSQFFYFIADSKGQCSYANTALLHYAGLGEAYGSLPALFSLPGEYQDIIAHCLREKRITATLSLKLPGDILKTIRWEFSVYLADNGHPGIQAIGVPDGDPGTSTESLGKKAGQMARRYKAYEQSPEGLWKFDSEPPVDITADPDQIIEHWRKYSYLAECNDNVAKMYGYEKAEDLTGTPVSEFIDFSNTAHFANFRAFIRNGFRSTLFETKEFDRYGNVKYFLNSMEGVVENGSLRTVWGTQQDITGQRLAEENLQRSELFYRSLIAESLDGILLTDEKGIIHFASPSITPIFGYSPEEIKGKSTFDFAHPDDRQLADKAFAEELSGNPQRKFISVRIQNKKKDWVWCIVRGHNLLSNPYIRGMVVYLYDDSLRKETEQALIQSESRFRTQATLLDNVTDVIVTIDMNRVVTSWNTVSEKLTGITALEAVGRPYRDVIQTSYHPFTNEQVFGIVQSEGIWRGEISLTGFDGETRYLLHTISLLKNEQGENTGMMGVGKDITERKRIEAQLQQSESFYRSLAANSLDGIILTDATGKITHCGPSVFHVSGYSIEQLLGRNIFDFVNEEDHSLAREAFASELKKESVINYAVMRLRHATRGWVWCTVRGHNLLHDPVLKGLVIYFTDDSKRKMIEDRLRESERRFRNLIHNLKLGVILQNERSEMLVCNQAALDMLGITEEQLSGVIAFDPRWNVIHEDGTDFPGTEHPVPVAIATKRPVRDVVMGVYRPLKNDRAWLLVNAEPVFDDDNNLINVICSFTDITEQRRFSQHLIEQEIQKQKLITQATIDGQEKERQEIGKELHDNINQHLTTTRLYLEVAREKTSGEVQEMINLAHKNLAEIVHEIRQISQSLVPPTLGDIGLIESIQDLCDLLKRTHSFAVEFQHRHFREDAIPDNMKLMIFRIIQEQVSNIIRHAQAQTITIRLQSDAEHIHFSIEDDGQGFDPQQHKKGMGLNNIINRAALFDGRVEIRSAPGKGCFVTVNIPLPASHHR